MKDLTTVELGQFRHPSEAKLLRRTLWALGVTYLLFIGLTLSVFAAWIGLAVLTVYVLQSRFRADTVEIGERQLPRVQAVLESCARRLGEPVPAMLVTSENLMWPVFTLPLPGPTILLQAQWIEMLTDEELSFFVYHELAHGKLGHRTYLNPSNVLENVSFVSWILTTPLEIYRYALRPWTRLADFSADRVALVCLEGRLDIVARALAKVTVGPEAARLVNGPAFLDQARRLPDSWYLCVHEVTTGRLGTACRLAKLSAFADSSPFIRLLGEAEPPALPPPPVVLEVAPAVPASPTQRGLRGYVTSCITWLRGHETSSPDEPPRA